MLDSIGSILPPARGDDWGFNKATNWKLKRCWRPQTCFLTGRQLWGRLAYQGIRCIHGPGEPVEEIYWVDKHEFLIWNLSRK